MSGRPGPGDDVVRAVVVIGLAAEAFCALAGSHEIEDEGIAAVAAACDLEEEA